MRFKRITKENCSIYNSTRKGWTQEINGDGSSIYMASCWSLIRTDSAYAARSTLTFANNMRKNSVQYTTLSYMANPVLDKSLCSDCFFVSQDFSVRTVSMEMVQLVYFCFGAKPANSKFATKTEKKKLWILSFFTVKLPEEAKRIEIFPKFQVLNQLSRMKGGVELLSIAKRTIDFVEAIFYQLCPVLNQFSQLHLTLTWSLFCNQENIVWSTRNPFSSFRINNCFCQIPSQNVFEVAFYYQKQSAIAFYYQKQSAIRSYLCRGHACRIPQMTRSASVLNRSVFLRPLQMHA